MKFKVGDKVKYLDISGKVVKVKHSELLGYTYLVKYSLFNKLWAFEDSLKLFDEKN